MEELETVLSKDKPLYILKHSTRCPISGSAYGRVQEYEESRGPESLPVYMVKVIESRPVSNAIAERLNVAHKSPQVILVKDGESVWSASHHGITVERLEEAAEKASVD